MPQGAIFREPVPHHVFLEYSVPLPAGRAALAEALTEARTAAEGVAGVTLVLGFGRALWEVLSPGAAPPALQPFRTLTGRDGKSVPSAQNDLWLWLGGLARDTVFEASRLVDGRLRAVAVRRLEQPGFVYRDSRDLTGFIDGTANPEDDERLEVALVPEGRPGAGGSHLIAMRWLHDLAAFHALPVSEQERVFGRTKADSEELSEADKPPTAHIARMEVEVDGEEQEIFRRSVPFATLDEPGLYFLAFSADPGRFDLMLRRMFGLTEDGLVDRLTDFSRCVHAGTYFAPAEVDLARALAGA